MNQDVFEGKWREMRGQIKQWWGRLTDDDLETAAGQVDAIVGLLQKKLAAPTQRPRKNLTAVFTRPSSGRGRETTGVSEMVVI